MKEKILAALKAAIGKTDVSEKTIQSFVDILAEKITEETQIAEAIKPYVSIIKDVQGNINSVTADAVKKTVTEKQAEIDKLKSEIKPTETTAPKDDDVRKLIEQEIQKAVNPLQEKLTAYETKEAQQLRTEKISAKSKALGIPKWRQKQGFVISENATEEEIDNILAQIKKDMIAAGLDSKQFGFPPSADGKPSPEEVKEIVKNLM